MYVFMYVFMYVCMHVCMHECMHVCMYVCVYINKFYVHISYASSWAPANAHMALASASHRPGRMMIPTRRAKHGRNIQRGVTRSCSEWDYGGKSWKIHHF